MPAFAWGTIRTARKRTTSTSAAITSRTIRPADTRRSYSSLEHQGRRALDLRDLDLPAGLEHGQRVLVQLEVRRVQPALRHLDGALVRRVRVAAHPADDLLGEYDPDLLV